jgi:hypothetical protein
MTAIDREPEDGRTTLGDHPRLIHHMQMMWSLSAMVAGELQAFDKVSEFDALMLVSNAVMAIGSTLAVTAVKRQGEREPDIGNWMEACRNHFECAVSGKPIDTSIFLEIALRRGDSFNNTNQQFGTSGRKSDVAR